MSCRRLIAMNFLFVALGGALGAVSRYAVSMIPMKTDFPVLTLITNILGALLIGLITGMVNARDDVSPNMVLFWKTGVCGGFTTFSTFSLEVYDLWEKGSYFFSILYMVMSVVFCLLGIMCGKKIAVLISG